MVNRYVQNISVSFSLLYTNIYGSLKRVTVGELETDLVERIAK